MTPTKKQLQAYVKCMNKAPKRYRPIAKEIERRVLTEFVCNYESTKGTAIDIHQLWALATASVAANFVQPILNGQN